MRRRPKRISGFAADHEQHQARTRPPNAPEMMKKLIAGQISRPACAMRVSIETFVFSALRCSNSLRLSAIALRRLAGDARAPHARDPFRPEPPSAGRISCAICGPALFAPGLADERRDSQRVKASRHRDDGAKDDEKANGSECAFTRVTMRANQCSFVKARACSACNASYRPSSSRSAASSAAASRSSSP